MNLFETVVPRKRKTLGATEDDSNRLKRSEQHILQVNKAISLRKLLLALDSDSVELSERKKSAALHASNSGRRVQANVSGQKKSVVKMRLEDLPKTVSIVYRHIQVEANFSLLSLVKLSKEQRPVPTRIPFSWPHVSKIKTYTFPPRARFVDKFQLADEVRKNMRLDSFWPGHEADYYQSGAMERGRSVQASIAGRRQQIREFGALRLLRWQDAYMSALDSYWQRVKGSPAVTTDRASTQQEQSRCELYILGSSLGPVGSMADAIQELPVSFASAVFYHLPLSYPVQNSLDEREDSGGEMNDGIPDVGQWESRMPACMLVGVNKAMMARICRLLGAAASTHMFILARTGSSGHAALLRKRSMQSNLVDHSGVGAQNPSSVSCGRITVDPQELFSIDDASMSTAGIRETLRAGQDILLLGTFAVRVAADTLAGNVFHYLKNGAQPFADVPLIYAQFPFAHAVETPVTMRIVQCQVPRPKNTPFKNTAVNDLEAAANATGSATRATEADDDVGDAAAAAGSAPAAEDAPLLHRVELSGLFTTHTLSALALDLCALASRSVPLAASNWAPAPAPASSSGSSDGKHTSDDAATVVSASYQYLQDPETAVPAASTTSTGRSRGRDSSASTAAARVTPTIRPGATSVAGERKLLNPMQLVTLPSSAPPPAPPSASVSPSVSSAALIRKPGQELPLTGTAAEDPAAVPAQHFSITVAAPAENDRACALAYVNALPSHDGSATGTCTSADGGQQCGQQLLRSMMNGPMWSCTMPGSDPESAPAIGYSEAVSGAAEVSACIPAHALWDEVRWEGGQSLRVTGPNGSGETGSSAATRSSNTTTTPQQQQEVTLHSRQLPEMPLLWVAAPRPVSVPQNGGGGVEKQFQQQRLRTAYTSGDQPADGGIAEGEGARDSELENGVVLDPLNKYSIYVDTKIV